jgi:hypothetical protein
LQRDYLCGLDWTGEDYSLFSTTSQGWQHQAWPCRGQPAQQRSPSQEESPQESSLLYASCALSINQSFSDTTSRSSHTYRSIQEELISLANEHDDDDSLVMEFITPQQPQRLTLRTAAQSLPERACHDATSRHARYTATTTYGTGTAHAVTRTAVSRRRRAIFLRWWLSSTDAPAAAGTPRCWTTAPPRRRRSAPSSSFSSSSCHAAGAGRGPLLRRRHLRRGSWP